MDCRIQPGGSSLPSVHPLINRTPNTRADGVESSKCHHGDTENSVSPRWHDSPVPLCFRWFCALRKSIGGKFAYRLGEASIDSTQLNFFNNTAALSVLRLDRRFRKNWGGMAEARMLDMPNISQRRRGALATIYRRIGNNLKFGLGYNFTDFYFATLFNPLQGVSPLEYDTYTSNP
jgi:hypothetical protein